MTKERRLAIQMWQAIRDMLSASDELPGTEIIRYKKMFCEEHRLRWYWNCWFCQYIKPVSCYSVEIPLTDEVNKALDIIEDVLRKQADEATKAFEEFKA